MEHQSDDVMPSRIIATMAMDVANYMTTRHTEKKHGGYNFYNDGMIQIRLDTYVNNLEISIIRDGSYTPVFQASHLRHDQPERYNPGRWCGHLADLSKQAIAIREEKSIANAADKHLRQMSRYKPVEDSDIFPQ